MRSYKERCSKCGHEWYVLVRDMNGNDPFRAGPKLPSMLGICTTATSTTPCDCFDEWDSDVKTVPEHKMVVRDEESEP